MVKIKPFKAWRPPSELAARVASLPYDVVSTEEARAQAEGNPYSFFHVSRAEIDLPAGADPYDATVYRRSAENFREFCGNGTLVQESTPCLYVYRLRRGQHVQSGVMAVCSVEDYNAGLIKKHEKTRQVPEDDRTRHISSLNANSGPVFLTYRGAHEIDQLIASVQRRAPLYDFTAADGIGHTVWRVDETDSLVRAFDSVPCFYIADGHHRAAAAARVARERAAAHPGHTGREEYNGFMTLLFPANQLQILPYNRCVKDLNGLSVPQFREAVGRVFGVTPDVGPVPERAGNVSMFLDGGWCGLQWEQKKTVDPVAALDVSVLQDRLLNPILGIDDPRHNPRIEFIGGIRGTDALERKVLSREAAVAFSMHPTSVDQLMAIADAGQCMPPKSTWFEPKPRSGLLVHTLD